jgi:hypothetical protein
MVFNPSCVRGNLIKTGDQKQKSRLHSQKLSVGTKQVDKRVSRIQAVANARCVQVYSLLLQEQPRHLRMIAADGDVDGRLAGIPVMERNKSHSPLKFVKESTVE